MLIDRGPIKKQIIKVRCSCCKKRQARWNLVHSPEWTGQRRKPTVLLCHTCKVAADKKVDAAIERMYDEIMNGETPRVRVIC